MRHGVKYFLLISLIIHNSTSKWFIVLILQMKTLSLRDFSELPMLAQLIISGVRI